MPVRVVASAHDTSVTEIERDYKKIHQRALDALSRRALLQLGTPPIGEQRRRLGALTVARKAKPPP